jgi:hypothetical protein
MLIAGPPAKKCLGFVHAQSMARMPFSCTISFSQSTEASSEVRSYPTRIVRKSATNAASKYHVTGITIEALFVPGIAAHKGDEYRYLEGIS